MKNNYFFNKCLTIFLITAFFSITAYIFLNNYLFYQQINIIFDQKKINLEKKMLERNDFLLNNNYITADQHAAFEGEIVAKLKAKNNQIIDVCQNVSENREFQILAKLKKHLSVTNTFYQLKILFFSLLSSAKKISKLIKTFERDSSNDDFNFTINETKINNDLKKLLFTFQSDVSQLYSSSFLFSIFNFLDFMPFLFLNNK